MKKIISLLFLLAVVCTGAMAQQKKVPYSFKSATTGSDTILVTNVMTKYLKVSPVDYAGRTFSVHVDVTKIDGSPAGGVQLQGSNNNSTWFQVTATGTSAGIDTMAVTNVTPTQTKMLYDNPSRFRYYRVKYTMSNSITGRVYVKAWGVLGY